MCKFAPLYPKKLRFCIYLKFQHNRNAYCFSIINIYILCKELHRDSKKAHSMSHGLHLTIHKTVETSLARSASSHTGKEERQNELFSLLLERAENIDPDEKRDIRDALKNMEKPKQGKSALSAKNVEHAFTQILQDPDEKRDIRDALKNMKKPKQGNIALSAKNVEHAFTQILQDKDPATMLSTMLRKNEKQPNDDIQISINESSSMPLVTITDKEPKKYSKKPVSENILIARSLHSTVLYRSRGHIHEKNILKIDNGSHNKDKNLKELLVKAKDLKLDIHSAKLETFSGDSTMPLSGIAAEILQKSSPKWQKRENLFPTATLFFTHEKESKSAVQIPMKTLLRASLVKNTVLHPAKNSEISTPANTSFHIPDSEANLKNVLKELNNHKNGKKVHNTKSLLSTLEVPEKESSNTPAIHDKHSRDTIMPRYTPKQFDNSILSKTAYNHIIDHLESNKPAVSDVTLSDTSTTTDNNHIIDKDGDLSASFVTAKEHSSQILTQKIVDARTSVQHFTQQLQEEIENYKPPFTRLKMQMDPKELGNVEVTLISRGNQLHIQIHSNPTAIGLMATQGSELKNQLVSMGFTDVQMQFSMNQQQQQERRRQTSQNGGYVAVEEIPDFYESLNLIIPQYV